MYNHSSAQMCLLIGTGSKVSDVAHGLLVVFSSATRAAFKIVAARLAARAI